MIACISQQIDIVALFSPNARDKPDLKHSTNEIADLLENQFELREQFFMD